MAGRAALGGDQREHPGEIELHGVGRREVPGDQHERGTRIRDAGHRHAEAGGDHSLPHVVQIGHPCGQVFAAGRQQLAVLAERHEDRVGGGGTVMNGGRDLGVDRGVVGHQGLRVEHVPGRADGEFAAPPQVGRDLDHGRAGGGELVPRRAGAGGSRRGWQRIAHPGHRPQRAAAPDTGPVQHPSPVSASQLSAGRRMPGRRGPGRTRPGRSNAGRINAGRTSPGRLTHRHRRRVRPGRC